jgi:hypothetical protein
MCVGRRATASLWGAWLCGRPTSSDPAGRHPSRAAHAQQTDTAQRFALCLRCDTAGRVPSRCLGGFLSDDPSELRHQCLLRSGSGLLLPGFAPVWTPTFGVRSSVTRICACLDAYVRGQVFCYPDLRLSGRLRSGSGLLLPGFAPVWTPTFGVRSSVTRICACLDANPAGLTHTRPTAPDAVAGSALGSSRLERQSTGGLADAGSVSDDAEVAGACFEAVHRGGDVAGG